MHAVGLFPPTLRGTLTRTACSLALEFALLIVGGSLAPGQTFTVLHNFTGGADGKNPYSPVTIDDRGDLYGTTFYGGSGGVVYKMTQTHGAWTFASLYQFGAHNDPAFPVCRGSYRSRTAASLRHRSAGGTHGAGAGFKLRPPPRTLLLTFSRPGPKPCCIPFRAATTD